MVDEVYTLSLDPTPVGLYVIKAPCGNWNELRFSMQLSSESSRNKRALDWLALSKLTLKYSPSLFLCVTELHRFPSAAGSSALPPTVPPLPPALPPSQPPMHPAIDSGQIATQEAPVYAVILISLVGVAYAIKRRRASAGGTSPSRDLQSEHQHDHESTSSSHAGRLRPHRSSAEAIVSV